MFCASKRSDIFTLVSNYPKLFVWHPQALHTYRINLSPFTKDFRVWGAFFKAHRISRRLSFEQLLAST